MPVEGILAGLLVEASTTAGSHVLQKYREKERGRRVSTELGDLETEFNDALRDRIIKRAGEDDIDSANLPIVGSRWGEIADRVDAYELSFEDEQTAVDELVERVVEVVNADTEGFSAVELDEEEKEELRKLISDEFADTVEEFRDRVEGDAVLQDELQNDLNIQILEETRKIEERLRRIAGAKTYEVYDFPEERDEVIERVEELFIREERPPEFVDREDGTVPSDPEPAKHFVVGPSGSGKSRIVAERMKRLSEEGVSHVLVPDEGLLSPTDARGIANEAFDGNLLLVWGDVHEVDQGEGSVVKNVLTKLDEGLDEQGYELYTLLEARSDRLENVSGDLPGDFENEFSKGPWPEYEPIWTEELDVRVLAEMVDSMVEKHEVRVGEEARDALVEKTRGSKSAPEYIDTALRTADGDELTVEDVEDLSDSVVGMWTRQYKWLGEEGHDDELRVLRSMKALYDFNISLHSRLVRSVYLELFDGDRGTFKTAVESLSDDRRWVNVVRRWGVEGDAVLDDGVRYYVHDTQLDAVGYDTEEDVVEVSELLLRKIEDTLPEDRSASAHLRAGASLYNWESYREAKEHWEKAIKIDPEYGEAYSNYGVLLHELDEPEEAAKKYESAIEADPELARVYHNYGKLLQEELDEPEEAAEKYEKAVEIDPEGADAYNNYGLLLHEELDEPEEAAKKYEKAIEHDPELAEAYYNYGNLLKNELDKPEEAAKMYEKAIEHDPELAEAYYNYGLLLCQELDELEEAAEMYEKAIEINSEYAEAYYNYGLLLWQELDEPEEAREKVEESVSLWIDKGVLQNALHDLKMLVKVCVELDDKEAIFENCELALNILDEAPHLDTDGSEREWFESKLASAESTDGEQ